MEETTETTVFETLYIDVDPKSYNSELYKLIEQQDDLIYQNEQIYDKLESIQLAQQQHVTELLWIMGLAGIVIGLLLVMVLKK